MSVLTAVQRLAFSLPVEWLDKLALALEALPATPSDWAYIRTRLRQTVPQAQFQEQIESLLTAWQAQAESISALSLALMLRTASQMIEVYRHQQQLALVWTGPTPLVSSVLRRTDQALLQLIESAQERLLIVSFAVYKTQRIAQALATAIQRGVQLSLCLETPETSEGKIAHDTLRQFGSAVTDHARIYIWPLTQRPITATGQHGSLHAKAAVADGQLLFISSANLTDYAMTVNMELGVLIQGGALPAQVESHFRQLIEAQVLVELA